MAIFSHSIGSTHPEGGFENFEVLAVVPSLRRRDLHDVPTETPHGTAVVRALGQLAIRWSAGTRVPPEVSWTHHTDMPTVR
jgi:hypothetical protein